LWIEEERHDVFDRDFIGAMAVFLDDDQPGMRVGGLKRAGQMVPQLIAEAGGDAREYVGSGAEGPNTAIEDLGHPLTDELTGLLILSG
jgi:hypothetical protein